MIVPKLNLQIRKLSISTFASPRIFAVGLIGIANDIILIELNEFSEEVIFLCRKCEIAIEGIKYSFPASLPE